MRLKYRLLQVAYDHKGQVRGRYAPSPSGVQHLGNIRTAIVAWLQARLANGKFALRMDDIDTPRVKPGSAAQIIDDLRWLGLDWDQFENILYPPDEHNIYTESHFITHYQAAFSKLAQLGLLYPCTCSRQDIRHKVVKPNEAGHYVYPGTCRGKRLEDIFPGQQFVWRCIVPDETVLFSDQLAGDQAQNVAAVWGDIIVKRFNGLFAYQLVSVVDDMQMGITDVVRGEDLLDSTPGQVTLFNALGAVPPRFWHLPLKTNELGEKLAKRDGADSLQMLREAGQSPEQVLGQLAYELELIDAEQPLSLAELLAQLSTS